MGYDVTQDLNTIREATLGQDMRGAIANAVEGLDSNIKENQEDDSSKINDISGGIIQNIQFSEKNNSFVFSYIVYDVYDDDKVYHKQTYYLDKNVGQVWIYKSNLNDQWIPVINPSVVNNIIMNDKHEPISNSKYDPLLIGTIYSDGINTYFFVPIYLTNFLDVIATKAFVRSETYTKDEVNQSLQYIDNKKADITYVDEAIATAIGTALEGEY